jgi:hypothetical protein
MPKSRAITSFEDSASRVMRFADMGNTRHGVSTARQMQVLILCQRIQRSRLQNGMNRILPGNKQMLNIGLIGSVHIISLQNGSPANKQLT